MKPISKEAAVILWQAYLSDRNVIKKGTIEEFLNKQPGLFAFIDFVSKSVFEPHESNLLLILSILYFNLFTKEYGELPSIQPEKVLEINNRLQAMSKYISKESEEGVDKVLDFYLEDHFQTKLLDFGINALTDIESVQNKFGSPLKKNAELFHYLMVIVECLDSLRLELAKEG